MKITIRLFMVMAAFLLIAGCSSPESQLVGKWVGKTGSIEFFKDKTGLINPGSAGADLPTNVKFQWDVEQKDRVRMIIAVPGGRTTYARFEGKRTLVVEEDKFEKM